MTRNVHSSRVMTAIVAPLLVVAAAATLAAAATVSPAAAAASPATATAAAPQAARDTVDLAARLRELAHPLRMVEGELRGAGARMLSRAGRDARFFAVGEAPHLRAVLPPFAGALFRLLREEAGYGYLALEEGPLIARLVSRAGAAGGRDSVMALARRYPTAFHMYTVEELRLMGEAASAAGDEDGGEGPGTIWGLNRIYGAWHVLLRLAEIAPNGEAHRLARGLADSARPYEVERFARSARWHVDVLTESELDRLRTAFDLGAAPEGREAVAPGTPENEARRLLEQLEISRRTFAPYHREDPEPTSFYESARIREENMKRLFARRYREAKREADIGSGLPVPSDRPSSGSAPRVMAKLGLYHLSRGRKMVGEVYTLGNFLSELARFEGGESFHLAVLTDAEEVRRVPLARPFLEAAPADEAVLYDFRPLHPRLGTGGLEGVDAPVRRLLLDYDAMVVLPDEGEGTVEPLRTPDFHLTPGG